MRRRLNIPVMVLILAALAAAQAAPVVIKARTVWDGNGKVLHNTSILVENGKITAVGSKLAPPPGAKTVNLADMVVMPGWIDAHVHITYHFGPNGKYGEREDRASADKEIAENARATLLAGFTTVQSVGSPGDLTLRQAIESGAEPGPRILTAVRPITNAKWTTDQIRDAVRRDKQQGADLIKIFASESIRDGAGRTLNDDQLRAACGEATAQGLRSLVHAYKDAVRASALAGCTEVEHGTLATADDLKLLAAHHTYFDPQAGLVIHNYLDNQQHFMGVGNFNAAGFEAMRQAIPLNIQIFKEALATPGLEIIFGTDAVAGAHGHNAEEFIYRVRDGGQQPMAALEAAQWLNAHAMGLDAQLGAIAPGLAADTARDITCVRQVSFVMKAGVIYKQP